MATLALMVKQKSAAVASLVVKLSLSVSLRALPVVLPSSVTALLPVVQPTAPPAPARPKSEIEVYLASLGMDNPALPSFIASMDDELAKDFVEKLIILSKFPKDIIKDLLDTVIRKRASIKNPSAWLVVSMKKEQPCNVYSMTGFCQHGDRCRFKHVEPP